MELSGAVTIITGAASGIGRACALRFAREGAAVAVADRDASGAERTAAEIAKGGGRAIAMQVDVGRATEVEALVARTVAAFGPVDLCFSNAGIAVNGGVDTPDDEWQRIWDVNVMAHVFAARAVLPAMLARGRGYLLSTASAAGLLSNIGTAPYSVTKHAAVALAEWLAITHGDAGITVSCVCPQGVDTPMVRSALDDAAVGAVLASGTLLSPDDVADAVVQGVRDERFLILPHPEVLAYWQRKTADVDRWLSGMRRLQARMGTAPA